MAKKKLFTKPAYVRTHPIPRRSLDRVLADLVARSVTFDGATLTQEALVNASWELLEEMGADWFEAKLRPILKRMETYEPEQQARRYVEKSSGNLRMGGSAQAYYIPVADPASSPIASEDDAGPPLERNLPTAIWEQKLPGAPGAEPGGGDGHGLEGEDRPVRKKRRPPRDV